MAAIAPRPVIGIVVLIDPKQHINIPAIGLKHDAAIVLIDAHRPEMGITGIIDLLVVDATCLWVATELADELHHLLLLATRNLREGSEETVSKRDFWLHQACSLLN